MSFQFIKIISSTATIYELLYFYVIYLINKRLYNSLYIVLVYSIILKYNILHLIFELLNYNVMSVLRSISL